MPENTDERLTILVNSCDKYSDIWDLYFEMLHISWPDCPYKIYLNTESLDYKNKYFDINVINLPAGSSKDNISWSERLLMCLKQIKSKYVLVTLDDIYFLNKINNNDVEALLDTLDSIKKFAMLFFYNYGPKYYKDNLDLYLCHKYCAFHFDVTCNLWNRESLLDLLIPGLTPWEAEKFIKHEGERRSYKYYCVGKKSCFTFDVFIYGIHAGKWTPLTKRLLAEKGITDFDFAKRGFIDEEKIAADDAKPERAKEISEFEVYLKTIEDYNDKPYWRWTFYNWRKLIPQWIKKIFRKNKK